VTVRSRAGRPASLRLYRVTGTQAYSAQSRTGCFTVTGLSPGAYLLRLETDHRIAESKLIVTK
jgi:hypothetical protein